MGPPQRRPRGDLARGEPAAGRGDRARGSAPGGDPRAGGTTAPAPDYYDGPRRLSPLDGDVVDGVYVAGTFEGFTQVLAGIDGDRAPFRVFTLTSPPRLVVDVAATE
ncbi:AMIN-like domain-containing (lipo)protein [Nocardioides sp. AX2bis]|uniref:AMIN-like domain-containing (lipo)protein n=1 Tax=Nocardioides sp. AX2bis TaxID=2653157 RepID=UPI003FA5E487